MFMRVWGKLGEFSFVEMMKGVWVEWWRYDEMINNFTFD
jgi:hypothetical protein